jgi:hypothetical protein
MIFGMSFFRITNSGLRPQVKRWNGDGLPSYLKMGDSLLVVLFKEEKTYAVSELQ